MADQEWNPSAGYDKVEIKKLAEGESITGKFVEKREMKNKKGEPRLWYVFDVNGTKTALSIPADKPTHTLRTKMEGAPQGVMVRVTYGRCSKGFFYNVERVA